MKKIPKSVTRSYLGLYLVSLFATVLTSMMMIKVSNGLLVTFFILSAISFALLITSNVLLYKKPKLHPYFMLSSFSLITLITLIGFVIQIVITVEGTKYGQSSVYGWIIYPLALIILAFALFFSFKYAIKQIKDEHYDSYRKKNVVVIKSQKEIDEENNQKETLEAEK